MQKYILSGTGIQTIVSITFNFSILIKFQDIEDKNGKDSLNIFNHPLYKGILSGKTVI